MLKKRTEERPKGRWFLEIQIKKKQLSIYIK
jgi:hypothetical protein